MRKIERGGENVRASARRETARDERAIERTESTVIAASECATRTGSNQM
jgi:hypothetical protein